MKNNTKRNINGILLLNKPQGITSNSALQQVKRIYNAKKAGHTGSLDPLATGMLPICLGEATKFSQYLLDADKTYSTTVKLGIQTTTSDAEGEIVATKPVPFLSESYLQTILNRFRGEIEQIPSMYSALKHQGQPLYKLAREGITVERKVRKVTIYDLTLMYFDQDSLTLTVRCSKGTYIRTLAEDIGHIIGCGAHLAALYRIDVTPFKEWQMHDINELRELHQQQDFAKLDSLLLPLDSVLQSWPRIELTQTSAYYFRQGQAVFVSQAPTRGWVTLLSNGQFLGVGEMLDDGRIAPRRLISQ